MGKNGKKEMEPKVAQLLGFILLWNSLILKEIFFSGTHSIIVQNNRLPNPWIFPAIKKNTYILFSTWTSKQSMRWSTLYIFIFQMEKPRFGEVQLHTLQKCQSSLYSDSHFPILNMEFFPLVCEVQTKEGLLMTRVLVLRHSFGTCVLSHSSTEEQK